MAIERQPRQRLITGTERRGWKGPRNRQFGITAVDACFRLFHPSPRMQIKQLTARFQNLETMGTTLGNQQGIGPFRAELQGMPLTTGGRTRPQIHCHIPYPATQAAHQLGFAGRPEANPHRTNHPFG